MNSPDIERTERVRDLNDELRRLGLGGRIAVTAGLEAHGVETVSKVLKAIEVFTEFDRDNDPHNEHDCAVLQVAGVRIIWKIDLYEDTSVKGKNDPSSVKRVLTVMLAEEY